MRRSAERRASLPFLADVYRLFAFGPKLQATVRDVREGRLSYQGAAPILVSRLDSPRGGLFIMDGHHRAVEAVLSGRRKVRVILSPYVPRIERTAGAYEGWIREKLNVLLHAPRLG